MLSKKYTGFTLVETMVVLTIVSILATLSVFMTVHTYEEYIHRSEHDVVLSLLEEARSHALNNFDQSPIGICAEPLHYVLFEGVYTSGATHNEYTNRDIHISISSDPPNFLCSQGGIVFTELSGTTSSTTIYFVQNNSTSIISVNYEGSISW